MEVGLSIIASRPIFVAIIASSICAAGLTIFVNGPKRIAAASFNPISMRSDGVFIRHRKNILYSGVSALAVSIVVLAWTKSVIITTPFSIFATAMTWVYLRNKERREVAAMLQVWPEVTDHLISAIHSGLSLTEALVGLGVRGPQLLRPSFLLFHQELLESGDFVGATERLKGRLNTHGSDQILEAILLAKSLGGSELLQIFRTLGDFLRQDLALRKEIDIKHGWIKNSAHLSSAAPWLLLLLLSSQPGTAQAFAQPAGVAILLLGVFLTSVAYLWMGKLGHLPKPPRVFE